MGSMGEISVNIGVIGLGFVGLTTALGFADKGFSVRGYDINKSRNDTVAAGQVPFWEPGLEEALTRTLGKRFHIAATSEEIATCSDVIFLCVGTPTANDGSADLRFLLSAAEDICKHAANDRRRLVVVKSTVPPGTTADIVLPQLRKQMDDFDEHFSLAVNPEFLREGYCWEDFSHPDRIVCGIVDAWSEELLSKIYAPFDAPIQFASPSTAEFIKYLSNSLLATLISFSNEMALIAEHVGGIDVGAAFNTLHQDKRWHGSGITSYIYPGCGYGGYCLPKDTAALSSRAQQVGFPSRILDGVISLNADMPLLTAKKIEALASCRDAKIGILGLSFKPNSDDVRDTPAAKIICQLLQDGYNNIIAYDPVASEAFRASYNLNISSCASKEAVCEACEVVAVVTTWAEFKGLNNKYPNVKWADCRYFFE